MMVRYCMVALVLTVVSPPNFGYSQNARKFKGRLVLMDGNQKALNNVAVRLVDQGAAATGTDGQFEIAIPNTASSVTLQLVDNEWNVIYPIGGKIGVPKDPNEVVEFVIGDSPKNLLTKALAKSNNELQQNLKQLGLKQDGIEQTLMAFRNEIQKMTDIKLDDLKNEIDLDSKRERFFPVLSASINNYINEAKDLKDAFKFTANHAFDDNQALQILTDAVNSYSAAFEDINKNHSGYEKMVDDLWESESRSAQVRDFFNYALGELHSSNIFTLNLKIRDINDYNRGNYKGSKKAFKETVSREIEFIVLQLERRLEELDKRAQVVISKLAG